MRYLFLFAVFMVIVGKVDGHLPGARRMVPRPLVPVGSSLTDPVWTGTSRMVPPPLVPVGSSLTDPVWTGTSRMVPPPLVPVGSSFTDPVWTGTSSMVPPPLVPVGSSFTDPVWTGTSRMVPPHLVPVIPAVTDTVLTNPGMLRGGWNNMFLPQGSWNNIGKRTHGQWPHTWNSQHIWNTGIAKIGNRRNNFNNNALASIDPWEQYRKFSPGYRSRMEGGISPNTIALQNHIPHSPVSRNYPWNTFAFDTNIPAVAGGINQGFINPPLQPNINNPFQNQGILPQSFQNSFPARNSAFV